jgi:ABC-2 type transport system permease protein
MTTGLEVAGPAAGQARGAVPAGPGWRVVAGQECRDLWWSGRGPLLLFLLSALLSGVTYLASSNRVLNFLEQREAVNLVVQFAVGVGVLVVLVASADGISGERERGTLESLIVTPVSRRAILLGKLIAALSLWFAAYLVSVPYVWVLARGVGVLGEALVLALVVGTVVAVGLASVGLLISAVSNSNKTSIAGSVFLLLVLFAPTQLPNGMPQGWFFDALIRLNPVTSALAYISARLVQGHSWALDLGYLVSPCLTVLVAGGALLLGADRIVRLSAGGRNR